MDISTFTKPLIEQELLDITKSPSWKHTTIYHGQDSLDYYKLKNHIAIAKNVVTDHTSGGIYAYFQESECLYIGKAKILWTRVRDHLQESCGLVNENRGKTWYAFFKKHSGNLDLYLLPLGEANDEGEALRRIVEILLTIHHKPTFLKFAESFSKNNTSF